MKRCAIVASLLLPLLSARAEPLEVLKEGNVVVSFEKSGDEEQIKAFKSDILPKVKSILGRLTSDLGVAPNASEAKVNFYSHATYATKFPQAVSQSISAFYNGAEVNASIDTEITPALENLLLHELTHLILGQTFGRKIPAWVNEGLAFHEERKNTSEPAPMFVDYNTIVVAKQKGELISIDKLEFGTIFHRDLGTGPAAMAYRTAYVAVYELIQKSGMESMRRYIAAVSKGGAAPSEFAIAFGMSYEKFTDFLVQQATKKT
jgi:hypothetical protein